MKHSIAPITKIVIDIIPHSQQRYETCGDWFRTMSRNGKSILHIKASDLGNDVDPYNYMSICVAYHELSEALACIANDITEQIVDDWDMSFRGDGEPGEHPDCPYIHQHNWATTMEKSLVVSMNLMWSKYSKAIDRLWTRYGKKV